MGKQYDSRGFRLMRPRNIYLTMFAEWLVLSIFAIAVKNTLALGMIVLFAIFVGWQMGVATERLDWDRWYKEKGPHAE